ncbi:hypothetical protein OH77DRAFT_1462685 [Trametes cingulata]|nr:hypothetical protein OH77DRAFT_1462685 [Trametes cingulata]
MTLGLALRRLSSTSDAGLAPLKTSLELLSTLGTPVPCLQGVVDTVLQIIEYAEAAKQNRAEARELAASAAQIAEALLQATSETRTDEIDDAFMEDIVAFHAELMQISLTMQSLARRPLWNRMLSRDTHAAAIAEHRRSLAHAVVLFQIRDGISRRRLMVRQHRELRDSLGSLSNALAERVPPTPDSMSKTGLAFAYRVNLPYGHATDINFAHEIPATLRRLFFFEGPHSRFG